MKQVAKMILMHQANDHRSDATILRLALADVAPERCQRGVVAIGNFDGVHLGHAALASELVAQARQVNGPAIVLTFDPHPLQILAPERFMPVLTTVADRAQLLRKLGVDEVVYLQTTPELLRLSDVSFFQNIIRDCFQACGVVEGFNFRFGRDRTGDNDRLAGLCHASGLSFVVVPPFSLDGAPVSSSRVRSALAAGAVREAARLLNRHYQVRGIVVAGQRRGQTLGFPTANLDQVRVLVPGDGVYAVHVRVDGHRYLAAANIGPNPTFGEMARKIEVHLLDFTGDLYGRELQVDFVDYLRATRQFCGAAELREQLHQDITTARRILSE